MTPRFGRWIPPVPKAPKPSVKGTDAEKPTSSQVQAESVKDLEIDQDSVTPPSAGGGGKP